MSSLGKYNCRRTTSAAKAGLDGANPAYLDTLAVALGLNGLIEEAVATEEKAIALMDDAEKAASYEKTLELLRSGEFSAADFR